ncbi:Cysteine--tRNA ligase [subsurface metagenome]
MSMHYLGESFDIHTGGEDLIFPHHENEIAQSVAATGKEYVRYWLHNGWVTLGGEKMAKSTGHYFLIEDVLKNYSPNVIRLYLLKTQYRNQIEFSKDRLDEAKAAYSRIKISVEEFKELPEKIEPLMLGEFTEAMNDDLNTPKALGKIYDLVKKGHEKKSVEIAASIKYYLAILGFREEVESSGELSCQLIDIILHIRNKLRNEKKYDLADEIRIDLENLGIKLADTKGVSLHRLEDK